MTSNITSQAQIRKKYVKKHRPLLSQIKDIAFLPRLCDFYKFFIVQEVNFYAYCILTSILFYSILKEPLDYYKFDQIP